MQWPRAVAYATISFPKKVSKKGKKGSTRDQNIITILSYLP